MMMNTNEVVSITEANQNFSAVARKADREEKVVIFKNNRPAYVLYKMSERPMELTNEERLDVAEARVMKKYRKAFEELAN